MFNERGTVVRTFVSQSGKFGALTVDCPNDRGSSKVDFISFDCIDDIRALKTGASVIVTGRVGMQKLTAKDKSEVKVDGFAKWVPQLVVTKIEMGLPAKKKTPPQESLPDPTDDVNWG